MALDHVSIQLMQWFMLSRCFFVCFHWISFIWNEVGYVTTVCFLCFMSQCIMVLICLAYMFNILINASRVWFNAFDKAADIDVLNHPILNFIFYLLAEILPSSLVLFILRKLPPKRKITRYHPLH
ncbi:unnamed protein product [Musa acuminata var. zebrina]